MYYKSRTCTIMVSLLVKKLQPKISFQIYIYIYIYYFFWEEAFKYFIIEINNTENVHTQIHNKWGGWIWNQVWGHQFSFGVFLCSSFKSMASSFAEFSSILPLTSSLNFLFFHYFFIVKQLIHSFFFFLTK